MNKMLKMLENSNKVFFFKLGKNGRFDLIEWSSFSNKKKYHINVLTISVIKFAKIA